MTIEQRQLVWINRDGREEPTGAPPRSYRYPRLSPDGTRVAVDIREEQNDIWIWHLSERRLTRFTFDATEESYPVWTPDGRRIAFGIAGLLGWRRSDGTGSAEPLTRSSIADQRPYAFTRDGLQLLIREQGVSVVSLKDGTSTRLVQGMNAELSPDGRWLAYEATDREIYVHPFPAIGDGRWQISVDGGTHPVWARNGRELFFLSPDRSLMRVAVRAEGQFVPAAPELLISKLPIPTLSTGRPYDVSPDGRRFLVVKRSEHESTSLDASLHVVLNWHSILSRVAP